MTIAFIIAAVLIALIGISATWSAVKTGPKHGVGSWVAALVVSAAVWAYLFGVVVWAAVIVK